MENTKSMFSTRPSGGCVHVAQMPLAMVHSGEIVKVETIRGKDEVKRFLSNLGFVESAEIQVVSELNGNMIVTVKGTRVAISKSMASRVFTVPA